MGKKNQNQAPVLLKRYDEAGHPYWCETRVAAHFRYKRTIKPLEDFLKFCGWDDKVKVRGF